MQTVEDLMRLAIAEAEKAMGRTHPNPAVGAVIQHRGDVVARGFTEPDGGAHAEVVAISQFRELGLTPDESTCLVVTMEPCSTTGRTGACTDAILQAGIRKVVVGATDPNPDHAGSGFGVLRDQGIEVTTGVLEADCDHLNLIFNWWQRHRTPFVAGKIATTIDGRIATRGGLSKWITDVEARADVHTWRRYFPAIAVGAGTVMVDDPKLTSRMSDEEEWSPIRFVFDRNLITFKDRLPSLYTDAHRDKTIVITLENRRQKAEQLLAKFGLQFWCLRSTNGDDGLQDFLSVCGDRGILGVYVEGGAHLLSSFLKMRLLHYLFAYRAPKLLADTSGLSPFMGLEPTSMADAVQLTSVRHKVFGCDQLICGYLQYPEVNKESD